MMQPRAGGSQRPLPCKPRMRTSPACRSAPGLPAFARQWSGHSARILSDLGIPRLSHLLILNGDLDDADRPAAGLGHNTAEPAQCALFCGGKPDETPPNMRAAGKLPVWI